MVVEILENITKIKNVSQTQFCSYIETIIKKIIILQNIFS